MVTYLEKNKCKHPKTYTEDAFVPVMRIICTNGITGS